MDHTGATMIAVAKRSSSARGGAVNQHFSSHTFLSMLFCLSLEPARNDTFGMHQSMIEEAASSSGVSNAKIVLTRPRVSRMAANCMSS